MPMGMSILTSGTGCNLMGEPSSRSRCTTFALNSEMPKSGKLVSTSDVFPMSRISPQSGRNASAPNTSMSKNQVKFVCDMAHDLMLLVRKPKEQPSLLARSIQFSTNAGWMERLVAFGQLDNWLSNKHKTTQTHE